MPFVVADWLESLNTGCFVVMLIIYVPYKLGHSLEHLAFLIRRCLFLSGATSRGYDPGVVRDHLATDRGCHSSFGHQCLCGIRCNQGADKQNLPGISYVIGMTIRPFILPLPELSRQLLHATD